MAKAVVDTAYGTPSWMCRASATIVPKMATMTTASQYPQAR